MGLSTLPEYGVWKAMLRRCYNPKDSQFKNYGARGIRVCRQWLGFKGFLVFLKDMGRRPGNIKHPTMERRDNDKSYSPENCSWVSQKQNNRNKRDNHRITYRGQTKTVTEWAEILGLNRATISCRIRRDKQTPTEALSLVDRRAASVIRLTIDKKTKTINEWSAISGVGRGTIDTRIRLGYSPRDAVFAPVGKPPPGFGKDVIKLTIGKRTETIRDWARIAGINLNTLKARLRAGYSHRDAVLAPLRHRGGTSHA